MRADGQSMTGLYRVRVLRSPLASSKIPNPCDQGRTFVGTHGPNKYPITLKRSLKTCVVEAIVNTLVSPYAHTYTRHTPNPTMKRFAGIPCSLTVGRPFGAARAFSSLPRALHQVQVTPQSANNDRVVIYYEQGKGAVPHATGNDDRDDRVPATPDDLVSIALEAVSYMDSLPFYRGHHPSSYNHDLEQIVRMIVQKKHGDAGVVPIYVDRIGPSRAE